jgi:hypothetical protein
MWSVVPADGTMLDRILTTAGRPGTADLAPHALSRFEAARRKTTWGRAHQQRFALVEGDEWLAGATRYLLAGVLDDRPVSICAIGDVRADPASHDGELVRTLIEHLLDAATAEGADLALLLSDPDPAWSGRNGFEPLPISEAALGVAQSPNHGAPMTLVRGGEERDLAAIVAMGRVRAAPFRFHLDRDLDFVQYAITGRRLLAGLGPPGGRQLQFFIAEEGITAAAYVVVSAVGRAWTIEECGDRDASGARVGAILQALIAREPIEHRPSIRGWLPPGFVPPQATILSETPSTSVMLVRSLGSTGPRLRLAGGDVLYWHGDVF